MTDLQCKKFYFAGNKMRILGRVSTTVQCIQNGRTGSNFHIKGFVVADLYKLLLPEGLSMVVYKISVHRLH